MNSVAERIAECLRVGGFWNPEAMPPDQMRDLLLDARNELLKRDVERDELVAALREAERLISSDYGHGVKNGYWPTVAPVLKLIQEALTKLAARTSAASPAARMNQRVEPGNVFEDSK